MYHANMTPNIAPGDRGYIQPMETPLRVEISATRKSVIAHTHHRLLTNE